MGCVGTGPAQATKRERRAETEWVSMKQKARFPSKFSPSISCCARYIGEDADCALHFFFDGREGETAREDADCELNSSFYRRKRIQPVARQ